MKILVAVDFSAVGKTVVDEGYRIALENRCTPVFFSCIQNGTGQTNLLKEATVDGLKDIISAAVEKYGEAEECKPVIEIGVGTAADEILKLAEEDSDVDMIIVGYKSHSKLSELFVGSTAAKVARYAPCSVLIYRPK